MGSLEQGCRRRAAALLCAWLVSGATAARADSPGDFDGGELTDASAIAFIYVPATLALSLHSFATPPARPRLFSPREGGASSRKHAEVPGWTVQLAQGALLVSMPAFGGDERWFHAKGFAQAWATNSLLTAAAKNGFGRQRPDYHPGLPRRERRSFPSGHSSNTLVVATYAGLYWRDYGPDAPLAQVAGLSALAAFALYVPYTRVRDRRHHVSDVLVGAVIGAAVATVFFVWNDRRYDEAASKASTSPLTVGFSF